MRHIKNGDLLGLMPEKWLDDAADALSALVALPPEERSAFINAKGQIWSELKTAMCKLSLDKCWYSEARIAPSELEIDHFRPKNRVTMSVMPHKGYWWLAFDWKNFRLAYSLINKRRRDPRDENVQGKGCYFPLVDENTRVPDTNPASVSGERPQLIDPCVKSDVYLLDYAVEDGKIIERFSNLKDEHRHQRARISIELFHLNEGTLIRDRHDLYVAISHSASRIEEIERDLEINGVLTEKQQEEYDGLIDQIGNWINTSAPFAAFARASVQQGGDRGWNTQLLMSA